MASKAVATAFTSLNYVIQCSALVLNTVGIYVLHKIGPRASKQKLLIINLGVVKITLTISELSLTVLESCGLDDESSKTYRMLDILNAGLYGINDFIILIITLDRFFATLYTIKYNVKVTQKMLMSSVACAWLLGAAGVAPFFFLPYEYLYDVFYKIVFLSFDALVLSISIITYGYILKQLFNRKQLITDTGTSSTRRYGSSSRSFLKQYGQFFYVSTLIIASFILFVVIPDTVYAIVVIIHGNEDPMYENVIGLVWMLYLITDPCIYIFLQKPVRLRVMGLLRVNGLRRVRPNRGGTAWNISKPDQVKSWNDEEITTV
eukprot:gene19067-20982_t